MSHSSEHQKMKPVLDLAHELDIATNPRPAALFAAGSGGFQVWCTPGDRPKGWDGITMNSGAFSKPCEYVGSVHWKWEADTIVGLEIETSAYALADQKPEAYQTGPSNDRRRRTIFNRPEDLAWLQEKVAWLFTEAGVPLPPFESEAAVSDQVAAHNLTHYVSSQDEYVVIVSPARRPDEFCLPDYVMAASRAIHHADEFPVDVILRPDQALSPVETGREPDEGPLVEQYENATRLGDDGWLEAAYEDNLSGWDE